MSSAKGANSQDARKRGLRPIWPRILVAYFLVSSALLIWPLHGWLGNHIEPRVFGLPWSYAYVLSIVVANFIVLALSYRYRWVDDGVEVDD